MLRRIRHAWHRASGSLFIIGLLSLVWFSFRTGTKPSRAAYPCQQAAAAQGYLWLAAYVFPLAAAVRLQARWNRLGIVLISVVIITSVLWGTGYLPGSPSSLASQPQVVSLDLQGRRAAVSPASDIFAVKGTSGNDGGLTALLDLMGDQGTPFYQSSVTGRGQGPAGLIAPDDTLIIKVNSQWDERGGTNTDMLKSLVEAVVGHPDGFTGEIIVADNGQAQYGSKGNGGSFDYSRNNALDITQSVRKVVDSFAGNYRVSTWLWDTITTRKVGEYSEGDLEDGYVLDSEVNPRTGVIVSYPKFKTIYGSYISFKKGIWDSQTQSYNSDNLKVINMPVLKSHAIYGVTASLKHYMGVGSDKLTARAGARMHNTVGTGGMGSEMVETRFPVLNILDAVWVNAVPGRGPGTSYNAATRTGIIAASTDPAALDYWASKNILVEAARQTGNTGTGPIDPDNTAPRSFGQWLRLSLEEIKNAGYPATIDEDRMNVYVSSIDRAAGLPAASSPPAGATSPASTPLPAAVSSSVPGSAFPSEASGIQPEQGWLNVLVRVVIPVIIAAAFIAVIIYRLRRKR